MPKVKITETYFYDLDISWINPDTDTELDDAEIEEIAREWYLSGGICDDDPEAQKRRDVRVLSASMNMDEGGLDVEVLNEQEASDE